MSNPRLQLAEIGRHYYRQGWLLGTSGNLSARLNDETFVISASGRDKGQLEVSDFVEASIRDGGTAIDENGPKASAESCLHAELYNCSPSTCWVLHTHTVASSLLRPTRSDSGVDHADFEALEMIKGYGLWSEDAIASVPVFPNLGHVPAIAEALRAYYATPRPIPAFVIAGHGITAWGSTAAAARRHLEVTEFLCQVAQAR